MRIVIRVAAIALMVLLKVCPTHVVLQALTPPPSVVHALGTGEQSVAAMQAKGWDFGDEQESVPTWMDTVRSQAGELALFVAFAALALVSFFRKSVRLKQLTFVASVLYLGVYRSQLISIVNVFGLIVGNLPIFRYNLGWYLFAVFTAVSTILWGRLYCGRICAFGALTQLLDSVVPARWRVDVPVRVEARANYVKYVLLGVVVLYFLATRDISIYRYVEPFWMFTGRGSVMMWTGLVALLAATVVVRNLYCRFLCPVGAFLGIFSNLTIFRIKRWSECKTCRICEKACEWGAIRGPKIVASECVRCDDCERLYDDTQKCVHWIVIRRKSDVAAQPSRVP
jgi:polyferredoxin